MWYRSVTVKRGQRLAWLVDGKLRQLFGPGVHGLWTIGGLHELQLLDVAPPLKPVLPGDPLGDDVPGARVLEVSLRERVAVLVRGQLVQVLEPGRWRWWEDLGEPTLLRLDRLAPPTAVADDDPLPATLPGTSTTAWAEPVLLTHAGRPQGVLPAGRYRLWEADPWRLQKLPTMFAAAPLDRGERVPGELEVRVAEHERVVVLRGGAFLQVLGPGRWLGWEAAGPYELLRFDVRTAPVALGADDPLPPGTRAEWTEAAGHEGLAVVLLRDGQPERALPPGRHRAWTGSRWGLKAVPLSLQALDVAPQDLLTADEVPLRVKPAVSVRVEDPVTVLRQPDWPNQVYLAAQLALRELVSARTLEALLAERETLGPAILERVRATLPKLGLVVELATIKDLILPGEVKELLARVTLARKEAEALSIKRREETASTRQLANTARMLENNPVLLRLKELEALGEIAARIDKITLVGSGGELVRTVLLSDLAKGGEPTG